MKCARPNRNTRNPKLTHYRFDAAFVSDEKGGAIYCRYCGLVMTLEAQTIEAPAEECIETPPAVHPPK